ncbi:MAG: right-handed parallel beta-helix repeat-containing protein [Lewinellaceae bacterium]|nr:right-handed parallel beta-helix repeat-containing protein [Lewinellaceae bacterium]
MRLNHSQLAPAANQTNPFCLFTGKFSKAFFLLPAICWLLAAQGLHAQTTWYVNAAAAPGGDGTSWAGAYQSLQQALAAAGSGHKIWVAEGTYNNGSFVMKNGVEILGGFPNTGNPGLGDRDWMAHVTTLSGGTNVILNNFTVGSPLTGTAVLDGFTITGGAGGANGGGMFNQYASPTVKNCVFSGNSALQGAGMYNLNSSSPTVTNCVFSDNTCDGPGLKYGGGMCNVASSPTVTNCLFTNNLSADYGGGLYNELNADPLVLNCTFSANSGYSAVHNRYAGCNPTIKNCIVWGNTGGITDDGASSTVTYSIVQGGFAGTGNLNVDPLFVSSTDFHLQNNSPARGAATSAGAPATDFDGDARPQSGGYDMGYDEVVPNCPAPGTIWYVNAAAAPEGNGASWDCAFQDVQLALAAASSGHKIWVAEGTYKPTSGTDRTISFVMKNGVEILGGFPNTGDPDLGDRDWVAHVTTLSGDVGAGNADSYHVIFNNFTSGSPLTSTAKLDGFTITGGNANGASANGDGGGMSNVYASPSVTNCTFSGNNAAYGGGMINNNYSAPSVTNCMFSGNTTSQYGAGMQNSNSSSPTVSNCTFSGNTATEFGGGMINQYSNPTVTNSTFLNNSTKYGGGMFNIYCNPIVARCTFSGNSAAISGGGIANYSASPAVTNCHFSGNSASSFGGGMFNDNSSYALVKSCSFSGNTATAAGGAMYNLNAGSPSVVNSILWGNSTEIVNSSSTPTVTYSIVQGGYAGTGNLNVDPLFVSQPPIGLGTTGDLHLQVCSPAIDAGTSAGAPATDLDGNARPFNAAPNVAGNYDMGAYEYQQALPAPTATCQNIAVQLDANGSVTVPAADINDGSTGGCGALSYEIDGQASRTFNCADIGVNTVTLTVTDAFNNTDDCSATITVADDDNPCCVPPVVTAPTVTQPTCALPTGTIFVNASGGGTLEYSVDNGATWDLDETFAGLAPGNYPIIVRLEANPSCETVYAGNPVELNSPFTPSTATDTWTGCVSTDWHTAGNWADGSVPTTADDVIIPDVANDPVISTAAFARQIDIVAGGNLLVEASGSLTISGSPDYGILNIGTVVNEGTIFINGTPGFGLYNLTPGSFTNKNLLQIGNLSGVGVGITNDDATFINEGGSITIDRCSGSAIKLNALGFQNAIFTNDGNITIGSLGTIGTEAISVQKACGGNCQASFSNTSCSALINIVASAANNVIVLSGGATFDNNGGRIIENSSGNSSITTNSGYVQNLNGGTFSIGTNTGVLTTSTGDIWTGCTSTDWHTTTNWLDGSVPTTADDVNIPNVTNDPVISAAAVAKSVHVQTSGALTINAGASLTVNGSFSDAGATQALKNDGTLDNSGILIIGSTTPSGQNGLVNTGVFNNNTGGEMTASRASTRGIFNSGTFTNYAKITLGVGAGSDVGPTGVLNTAGTFSNSGCTALFRVNTNAVITTSGGTFTNSGSIIENATGNSIISTNSGFVQNLNGGSFFIGSGNSSLNAPGVVWTGCTSTDWYTASNWMLGVVPTSSSDVKIAKLANDPIIDAAVLAKTVHVLQGATLTINATKSLTLDGSFSQGSQAMLNNGTVNNNGVITIGATTSSGYSGLSNYGPFALFNNNAGAEIVIDRATGSGLFNQRTFNNSGKITIGASNSTGFRGLENQQNFNNNAGGEITIDNSTEFGLANFALTFNNSGKITIGAASVSVGINGIRNTSFTNFNNNPGGEIKIDNSTSAGIYNQEGTFTNAAKITIGAVANVGDYGLRNTGTFSNNTGGEIAIDRSTLNGLYNQTGTITNAAEITIGALASVGTNGVQNLSGSTFTNSGCTALLNIVANAVLSNDGTFNNSGRIIENASGNSSITSNSGTVQNLNGGTFSITTNTGGLTTATGDIWTGCLSTDWHTAGNWFDGSVPTAADTVVVPDAINDPVIGAAAVANSVNLETGGALTVEATGSLPINSAASPLFTNSGTVVNEGTISLNTAVSFNFHRLLNLETGTFTNKNVLQLGNSGSQTVRGIYNRGSFVNATGGSISIAKSNGGIFQDAGSFVNNANIVFSSVNNSADSTAIVLFGGTFSNTPCSATILDQPGSNLSRFSADGGTFTNDGLLTENSSGSSSITNNTGIVQNLGGGSFNITNNTGVLTTNPGPQTACCPPANIFYVNAAATGANNGSSWADAFTDLQNALNSPCTGITQIWVAEGTYKPTSGTDRSISFAMKNGVEILGGFPNTGDPDLDDRDWAAHVTTLSGEIGAMGMADNTLNIIKNTGLNLNATAVIDGFQIAFANGTNVRGGGIENGDNSSPTIRNCAFLSNVANFGGAINNNLNCSPTITNCTFTNNTSVTYGGAVMCESGSAPTFTDCTFSNNTSTFGGGIFSKAADLTLNDCDFSNNAATSSAGAVYRLNGTLNANNCTFTSNTAIRNGGAMEVNAGISTITECTFSNNTVTTANTTWGYGGAIFITDGTLNLTDCAFFNSASTSGGGAVCNQGAATMTVERCQFKDNVCHNGSTIGTGGALQINGATATLSNCLLDGNQALGTGDDGGGALMNYSGTLTVINSTIVNNHTARYGGAISNYNSNSCTTVVKNTIFSNNTAVVSAPTMYKPAAGSANISHSLIPENTCPTNVVCGAGNLFNVAPFFVSATDFHLQDCSPAIDAANDAGAPATDFDQNARFDALPNESIADMGAYEYQSDATPTVANCQTSVDAVLDNNGLATVLATALNNGSTGCSPLVFSIDGQSSIMFDCSQIGNQSVTLTATYVNRTSTCATTVHVLDNTAPTITCPANIAKTTDADQCTAVTTYSVTASDNCAYTLTRTSPAGTASGSAFPIGTTNVAWSVTDAGGNATSCAFTVTVTDEQLPGITCPNAVTVTCSGNVPAVNLAAVTATDNCGAPVKSHVGDATSNQTCANRKTVTRTYKATDVSGNTKICSQIITVYDNVKPNFTSVPANVTVQCNSIPAVGTATATDGCGGSVTVAYTIQTTEPGACPDASIITRQWTATDACGNTKTATQRITVIDTQKPNFVSVPANITVQCSAIPNPATPTATDNCDAVVAITYNGETTTAGACANAYTLTRRWTAEDNCSNTRSISQRITVVDNGKPVFTAFPANTTIACNENPPAVGSPTASDGCGSATVTYLGQTTTGGNCPGNYQIKRTWRATDACGNSTAATQTIQVSDNGAPVFVTVPGPLTIECNQPIPPLVNPTASDACGGYVHITFLGNVASGSGCAADYTVTRTWQAADMCGNTATATQVITVLGNNNFGAPEPEEIDRLRAMETRMPRIKYGFIQVNQPEEKPVEIRGSSVASAFQSSLGIQPNPTTDRIWLDLTDFASEAVTVSIFSDLGRLVWENRIPAVEDLKMQVSLREAGAAAGMYTVSVRSASGVATTRVVLVE